MAGNNKSGRRPKPADLKLFEGNRGKRTAKDAENPKPTGTPQKPRGIGRDPEASKMWDRLLPMLVELGYVAEIDTPALQVMCELWQLLTDLNSQRRVLSEIIAEGARDDRVGIENWLNAQTAYINLTTKITGTTREWRSAAACFGLTPADRAKLISSPNGQGNGAPADPAEAFFNSG